MYQSQLLTAYYFKPLEIYTTVAVIYIFMVGITSYIADLLDKKIKKSPPNALYATYSGFTEA